MSAAAVGVGYVLAESCLAESTRTFGRNVAVLMIVATMQRRDPLSSPFGSNDNGEATAKWWFMLLYIVPWLRDRLW